MTQLILDGIVAGTIDSHRLRTGVLERPSTGHGHRSGDDDGAGPTAVFVHGNVSSALFWQPTMRSLPDSVRALALDLRGFGNSDTLPVDATRGLRDYSDDVAAALEQLGVTRAHLVGWSMGAGVVLQLLLDHPDLVASVTLVSPVSPYGFGGTAGAEGRRLTHDDAGTGAGGANPDFVARLADGDETADEQTSPRSVYQTAYVKPPFSSDLDDVWVASMLTTATGDGNYPGTALASDNWPGFAPGELGVLNTMAPRYFNVSGIVDLDTKPPILWVHGADDAIVSDTSFFDINFLGQLGVIPGWPGAEVAPPQPMIAQTRAVLDAYRQAGGVATEVTFEECGHSPHLEHPTQFAAALAGHLRSAS
ncbi:alpha/beta hydrolase [Leifsonia kafniensis]|uniref:Alpha/beta hydrolase n=1 Tax=Leifsonia kafniensis TaxID=475957 RepID=A0ABP7L305_9MICO